MLTPLVSVVIEGYNESLDLGNVRDVMEGLRCQDYDLNRVEVLLVGSADQCEAWRCLADCPSPFAAIRTIAAAGEHYYALKNLGAVEARGSILAMLDSDVVPLPGWLRALTRGIEQGAEVTCGPSLFRTVEAADSMRSANRLTHQVAASISWAFILGEQGRATGFLSHNLAMRKRTFDRLRYRTDYGRTCAGSILADDLLRDGIVPCFLPAQRVAHAFDWTWWCSRLHVRFGHEVYLLHRMSTQSVSQRAKHLGPLDCIATPLWHNLLDFRNWGRFSSALELGATRRAAGYLLLIPLSMMARTGEMVGMLGTWLAPARLRAFAAKN